MDHLYDRIGSGYAALRRADPRLAAAIAAALGEARSVANVGAGAGSYEPQNRLVVAVEPSMTMIRQRPQGSAPAVCASARHLPLRDASFDATLAVLTMHHWPDQAAGVRELARVARRRVVILTWDPTVIDFWLLDYFPQILTIDRAIFPPVDEFEEALGSLSVQIVPIPHDCTDGFLGAYWRRPSAYLDGQVRAAISAFPRLEKEEVDRGLRRLEADLADGTWKHRHGHVLGRESLDLGYRLVVANHLPRHGAGSQP